MKKTYHGSCHCGAVRFECALDLDAGTTRCNCSFCRKSRMWFALVPAGDVRVVAGGDGLVDYQRATPRQPEPFLHFTFCRVCGVRPFTRGGALPQLGGEFYAVNVACLDDAGDEELARAPIHYADGRNDKWDAVAAPPHYL